MKPLTSEQVKYAIFKMTANGYRIIHPDGTDMTVEIALRTPPYIVALAFGLGEEEEDEPAQRSEGHPAVPEGTEGNAAPTSAA